MKVVFLVNVLLLLSLHLCAVDSRPVTRHIAGNCFQYQRGM